MVTIHGTFHSIDKPAGHKRPGFFFLMPKNSALPLLCSGKAPELKKGTPLILTGDFTSEAHNNFAVSTMEFDTSDPDVILSFFSGVRFPGLTKRLARSALDSLRMAGIQEKKDWASLPLGKLVSVLKESGVPEKTAGKMADAIGALERRKELRALLSGCRVTDKDIEVLTGLYGGEAYEKAKSAPYRGLSSGVSFGLCDDLAFYQGIEAFDEERTDAFNQRMGEYIAHSGSCCMRLGEFLGFIRSMQGESRFPYIPQVYFLLGLFESSDFVVKESRHYGPVVYPRELYYAEQEIVKELARLCRAGKETGWTGCRDTESLDHDQVRALGFLRKEGVKILTGGPGAGKTTAIRKFIKEYRAVRPDDAIQLCAPTGRAAVRITESCGGEYAACTIHKLLDIRPFEDQMRIGFGKDNPLPKGLYIVDEMSMVGELLFLQLLRALPDGTMLILVGDPDQLPSVQAGTVLKDLLLSGKFEHVALTGNHRQGNGGSIVANYRKIKNRETDLLQDSGFQALRAPDSAGAMRLLARVTRAFAKAKIKDYQILTPCNLGDLGKTKINTLISEARVHAAPKGAVLPGTGYCIGDKIIMTRNNYQKHYWNGDIGIITRIVGAGEIEAMFYDGIRTIDREAMTDMEHAFATTIHKAQGSEFDYVIVVLGKEYGFMNSNALILTAVTRARKGVVVISENDALEQAVVTEGEAKRITGLRDMLEAEDG